MEQKGIWTQIVEKLDVTPIDKMEDLTWQMDAEVLKTLGSEALIKRMNYWNIGVATKLFNKGYKKRYMWSNDENMDYGIMRTPLNQIGAFDVYNVCKVKVPKSFADDEDRLNFIKVLRMTHYYMDAIQIDKNLLPNESDYQSAVIMACLMYNKLLQKGVIEQGQAYILKGKSDEKEARLLAGLTTKGTNYTTEEWGKKVVILANKYTMAEQKKNERVDPRMLGQRKGRE